MSHSSPWISVIICTYNRDPYLYRAMQSIAFQDAAAADFELLVINNNSTDNTTAICEAFGEKYPGLRYRHIVEYNQGLSHARNRGIREAKGEILVFLDDDAFAEKDYVSRLIRFYREHPSVMAAGGRTIPLFEEGTPHWMSRFLLPLVAAIDLGAEDKPLPRRIFPIGANMSFRAAALAEVGAFDVNLGRKGKNLQGGEEKDIFNRLRALGYQPWYVPGATVHHIIPASRTTPGFIRRQAYGVGYSERIRVSRVGFFAVVKRYMLELFKWVASLLLFVAYTLKGAPARGFFLLRFRAWVSAGLFFKKEG